MSDGRIPLLDERYKVFTEDEFNVELSEARELATAFLEKAEREKRLPFRVALGAAVSLCTMCRLFGFDAVELVALVNDRASRALPMGKRGARA